MRIIQVIPTLAAGGLERVATTLAIGLADAGDDVVVCTRGTFDHQANGVALRDAGVPIVLIPRPTPAPRELLRSAYAIARAVRTHRPDVIHAHNPAAAAAAAVARVLALRPRTPVVTTFHGLVDGGTRMASRILNATSDAVVGVGPAATAELRRAGVDEARLVTILNAVTAEAGVGRDAVRRELDVAGDAELVVTVGRYSEEKDQELLLRAAAILAPGRPRLRVLLVGVGPIEEQLRARISELGLDGIASMTGLREDAVDIVAAADVATLTSKREGLGLSLIEAMWVGTPTVGTNVGGIPDVIADGETGLLVPAGDAPALATAIARLLDDAALAQRLSAAARASAETRFSIATMTGEYRAAYERVLAGRNRSAKRRAGARPST